MVVFLLPSKSSVISLKYKLDEPSHRENGEVKFFFWIQIGRVPERDDDYMIPLYLYYMVFRLHMCPAAKCAAHFKLE